jgi:hypothetical protein
LSHRAGSRYWRLFDALPPEIQQIARENFALLRSDPRHPSLHFKRVGNYWSVRVGRNYRAVAIESADGLFWFWIGLHDEYKRLIRGQGRIAVEPGPDTLAVTKREAKV